MTGPKRRDCLDLIKPYVPGKPVEEVERELGLSDVIKLASNENALGPSPLAVQALKGFLERLHFYPDGNCFYLKRALAAKLAVESEQLIVGNGSDELLILLAAAYAGPGDEAVAPYPTFSEYEFAMRMMGGAPCYIPLAGADFTYDLEAMAAAVNERTRLVFICSPNNPTGTIVKRAALERFLDRLPPGILVVLDQAYLEYATDPEHPSGLDWIRQGRPVIALRTFSKIYGLAGLRIGYGIAPAGVIEDLNRVRQPFNVNAAAQAAALAALGDEAHLRASRKLAEESRMQLAAGLAELGFRMVPSQTNFCFVDLRTDSKQVFQALLRRGVIVRTGDIFGYPTHIRVTFGTAAQNERFLEALKEVLSE